MNILFLFASLPHLSEENQLFSALVNEFHKQGHNVLVSSRGQNCKRSDVVEENGIQVLRIKNRPFTGVSNPIKKALAYQEYVIKQRYYIKKYWGNEKVDLIISHSLPPELAWVVGGLKKHFNCRFYLIQSDYTWQDAVSLGYFSQSNPICLYYKFWEKKLIKLADYIACPTKGNIEFLLQFYPFIEKKKFDVIPFWQKAFNFEGFGRKQKEGELEGKFVVVYGGSIGAAQRVERIVDLAKECKEIKDIVFLILGRGTYLPQIKKMAADNNLQNVIFKEFLPREEYLKLLGSCDVGLVILNEKTGTPNFPSKSLSYFNMRVPVLAALDYVTDFGIFLDENGIGKWAYSDDINKLKERLMEYYDNPKLLNETREKAYQLFMNAMQPENAYNSIVKKVKQ